MRLSDQSIRGRTVVAADGHAIGAVAALFVDADTWHVESLQVKLRNDIADRLGAPHNVFHSGTVEVPIRMIQSIGDAVVLGVSVAGLKELLAGTGPQESAPLH